MTGESFTRGALAPDFAGLRERARDCGAFVFFLPLAGAPICCEDVRGLAGAATELGAPRRPLVVVSVDRGDHLRRFLDEMGGAALEHVGDPSLAIAASFGVRRPEGFAARASFLIAREGHIVASALHPIGFPRPVELLHAWLARQALD